MEENMIFCPKCGQKQSSSNKFCIKCGAKIPPVNSHEPEFVPTPEPEFVPTPEPEIVPTPEPEYVPTPEPEIVPTPEPENIPTPEPEFVPTPEPEHVPTPEPEYVPTPEPEIVPTPEPEQVPTPAPEQVPTPAPDYTPPFYAQSTGERPPETPYMQNPAYVPYPAQNAPAPKKKKGHKVILTIVIILAALLLVGGGGLLGAYLGGAFDSYQSGSGNDDEDEDKGKDKDKDKDKGKDTAGDDTEGGDTSEAGETDGSSDSETDGNVTETDAPDTQRPDTDAPVVVEPEPVYAVNDFIAFSNGEATLVNEEDLGSYTRYTYSLPEDSFLYVIGEYGVAVMMESVFDEMTEWTSPDEADDYFALKYIGEGEVAVFDDDQKGFSGISFEMGFNTGGTDVYICIADGIEFADKGQRTTFKRSERITDVSIDFGGALYYDDALSSWIPVGYRMYIGVDATADGYTELEFEPVITVSDESVLRYDPDSSEIIAVGAGTATITATVGDVSDSVTFEVYPVTDRGNTMVISPSTVDSGALEGESYFTTRLTCDFREGGDMLSFDVLCAPGVEVYDMGDWDGSSIDITFKIDADLVVTNSDLTLAVFCGYVYYDDIGLDPSTDMCTVVTLNLG